MASLSSSSESIAQQTEHRPASLIDREQQRRHALLAMASATTCGVLRAHTNWSLGSPSLFQRSIRLRVLGGEIRSMLGT